jgi:hypothetical protein
VDAEQALGRQSAHLGRDEGAGVVALGAEAFVPEPAHQLEEGFRHAPVGPAGLVDRPREAVAGKRGDHEVEVARERLDHVQVDDDRTRPAV